VLALSLVAPAAIAAQQQDDQAEPPTATASQDAAQPPVAPSPAPPVAPAVPEPVTATRATASSAGTISIGDYFYSPSRVEASVGERVSWKNNGKVEEGHTVTGDGFDSGVLKPGDTYSHSFSQAGTYPYICTLHANMKGRIVVVADQDGGGGGSNRGSAGGSANESGEASGGASGARSGGFANPESGSGGGDFGGGGNGNRSLPASGSRSLLLALYGIVLLELGMALRLLASDGWPRRGRG
jgi:plastocyanin